MNKLGRRIVAGILSGVLVLGMAGCDSSKDSGQQTNTDPVQASGEEPGQAETDEQQPEDQETPETPEDPGETDQEPQAPTAVTPDVPMKEITLTEGDADYYKELLDAEIYNYKLVRNIPTAYDAASWDNYCAQANILLTLDPAEIGEVQEGLIKKAFDARQGLVQIQKLEDSIWYIWGDTIPTVENEDALKFTLESYDNSDFKPFLVPFLLEDQSSAKGNMIIIAGGGFSSRGNSGEGWPIAKGFNALGYNCYVLQRRVEPYGPEDIWMDMQRSIRYVRHHAEALGIQGTDCMIATGFSGGGATVLGAVEFLYGDIQPTIYVDSYVPDEVDGESADLDVAVVMYGPHARLDSWGNLEGLQSDFETDNENLPAMFLAAGADDPLGTSFDSFVLAEAVKDRTLVEYHNFENVGHGFGVGVTGTNSAKWMDLADGFIDLVIAKNAPKDSGAGVAAEVPAEYTKVQVITYPFQFGDTDVTAAVNDDNTKFYAVFTAFEEEQILEGTVDNNVVTVTFDKSGFMSGDAQAIYDSIDPNGWNGAAAGGGAAAMPEIPSIYTKAQTITYPFQFGDTDVVVAVSEDGAGFYAIFTAFEEEQILEGIVNNNVVTVTFDKSGFMSGDAQAIYDSVDPEAWKPVN